MPTPSPPHRIRLPAPWQIRGTDDREAQSSEQSTEAQPLWDCERMFNLPSGLDETSQLVFEVRLTDDTLRLFDCAVNGQGLPLESASAESPHHYRFDCPQSCLTSRNEVRLRVGSASPKAKPAVALHPQSISELIQVALVITER